MAVKKTQQTRKKKKSSYNEAIIKEVISLVMIAASVFFMLGIYTDNSAGAAGNAISGFFRGLLGIGAYILPFAVIGVSIYILFDKKKTIPASKAVMGIVLFLLFISFTHILSFDSRAEYMGLGDYISRNYQNGSMINGGLVGAMMGNFLLQILGQVGSYILIITSSIILVMLLTGKSFFDGVSNAYHSIRENMASGDEIYEEMAYYDDDIKEVYVETKRTGSAKQAEIYDFEKGRERKRKEKKILLPFETGETADTGAAIGGEDVETGDIAAPKEDETIPQAPLEPGHDIKLMGIGLEPSKAMEKAPKSDRKGPGKKTEEAGAGIAEEIEQSIKEEISEEKAYEAPPIELLRLNPDTGGGASRAQILQNSKKLEDTLKSFGVEAKVIEVSKGPTVTRYELSPGQGVKVSKISNLADDLALNLAANGIRIEAPIPGKAAVGIEVPNKETQTVYFREVIDDDAFKRFPSKLAFGLGKDIAGKTVVADIAKMPHLLIAGATGSGKSVCINTLISSIIYKATPEDVKLIMVDPKVVELSVYNGIPHLMIPVVTDPKKAAGALNWAVREMLQRYELFATSAVRDLKGYNAMAQAHGQKTLPQIVIIIDELADLMMAAPGEVEDSICRLAQMARAAGLHLIIATQRPSVDVITGVIKANIPSRLAFSVSSGTDSRTILDMVGAEKLLGKGDMLFYPIGMNKPMRVQGAFISDKEVEDIVEFLKKDAPVIYDSEMEKEITSASKTMEIDDEADEFFEQAAEFVIQKEKASASMLQRQFRIGYNRASRLVEDLQNKGIVGPEDGAKPRKVLLNMYQWQQMRDGSSDSDGPAGELPEESAEL